jgi:sporulation protein YlmC with PRC-barrel domain
MKNIPLNVEVICNDGKCGKSSHVIINPLNQVITHIVVQNEDFADSSQRLVPVDQILATSHKSIQLRCAIADLAAMEKFTETHYINSDAAEYSSFGLPAEHIFDEIDLYSMWPYVYAENSIYSLPIEDERIPPGEIAVRRGADVEATDGHVGRVDEFVVDPRDGHITHLVLREGHLWNKKELTLPLSAIERMDEYAVYLKLDKTKVKSLPAIPVRRFYSR